jgi:endo-1,4-beta-D-glucanase Y
MGDQALFDGLWKYSQQWLNDTGLMHWLVSSDGTRVLGSGAASDADEDIAWALVMADRQWGGNGSLEDSYSNLATTMIQRVWDHEIVDGKLLKAGDSWGGWDSANVSYFMPNYYRVFAEVSGNQGWLDVVATSYDTMYNSLNEENGNAQNGLVPAWSTSDGQPNGGVWGGSDAPTHYQYDSCRTPFRIGVDYCLRGEPLAYDYVQLTSAFFAGIGVANMTDGYELDGTPRPQFSGLSAAFVGTAVGAMSNPAFATFLDEAYEAVRGLDLLVGGAYYDESWTVLSLLMMTGNFLDYTQLEPLQP